MIVEFVEKKLASKKFVVAGKTYDSEQKSAWLRVMVDGKQWGLVPADSKDLNYRVFHPTLSNLPESLCKQVVANSGGRLTSTLSAPVHEDPIEEVTEYDE